MKLGPEETFQAYEIIPYLEGLEKLGVLAFTHVPNGGKRHMTVAKQMKALGQRRGFPDLIIMANGFVGFIEVKRPRIRTNGKLSAKGVMSDEQKAWRDYFNDKSIPWALVESMNDLEATLREWRLI